MSKKPLMLLVFKQGDKPDLITRGTIERHHVLTAAALLSDWALRFGLREFIHKEISCVMREELKLALEAADSDETLYRRMRKAMRMMAASPEGRELGIHLDLPAEDDQDDEVELV